MANRNANTEVAEAKKTVAKKNRNSKLVQVKLFQDGGKYKDDVVVIVNGKAYRIQRGKTIEVPRTVALVLERSSAQDTATAQLIARESAKYASEAKANNI